jgi:hypothetical protein
MNTRQTTGRASGHMPATGRALGRHFGPGHVRRQCRIDPLPTGWRPS